MNAAGLFRAAWQAIIRNRLRSFLTMLGVIIGVAAVITSMAIGSGAEAAVLAQIDRLGANLVVVTPGSALSGGVRLGAGSRTTLKLADVDAILTNVPEIAGAAPYSESRAQAVSTQANWSTSVGGSTPSWLSVENWTIGQGRFFSDADVRTGATAAVLGSTTAQNLFPQGGAVGNSIVVNNVSFRVTGVLQSKGQSGFGRDQDDIIIVPITTLQQRISGQSWVSSIMISASSADSVAGVVDATDRLLRLTHHLTVGAPDDFTIRNISDVQQVRIATSQTQTLLLAAIAVVSLVVGGIGIMNIMLVSVTERTREIGLRMAVGARGRDILWQFLVEALTLSSLGGLIGVAFGIISAHIVSSLGHWPVLVSSESVVLGFLSAALVGALFGFYPAQRASSLDPIVALRYE